ncbi:E3 ubiquitin-protein ligase BRE1A [Pelomyxa schiedti]|nr:E3 ubiquitin-protein ligase BRE1A [Pelomyxa schiedti]
MTEAGGIKRPPPAPINMSNSFTNTNTTASTTSSSTSTSPPSSSASTTNPHSSSSNISISPASTSSVVTANSATSSPTIVTSSSVDRSATSTATGSAVTNTTSSSTSPRGSCGNESISSASAAQGQSLNSASAGRCDVKMEPISTSGNPQSRPAKRPRKTRNVLGELDIEVTKLDPSDFDLPREIMDKVENFQKQQLLIKLRERNAEIQSLKSDNSSLRHGASRTRDAFFQICRAWDRLEHLMDNFLIHSPNSNYEEPARTTDILNQFCDALKETNHVARNSTADQWADAIEKSLEKKLKETETCLQVIVDSQNKALHTASKHLQEMDPSLRASVAMKEALDFNHKQDLLLQSAQHTLNSVVARSKASALEVSNLKSTLCTAQEKISSLKADLASTQLEVTQMRRLVAKLKQNSAPFVSQVITSPSLLATPVENSSSGDVVMTPCSIKQESSPTLGASTSQSFVQMENEILSLKQSMTKLENDLALQKQENSTLKAELESIPESRIVTTTTYKSLLAQFTSAQQEVATKVDELSAVVKKTIDDKAATRCSEVKILQQSEQTCVKAQKMAEEDNTRLRAQLAQVILESKLKAAMQPSAKLVQETTAIIKMKTEQLDKAQQETALLRVECTKLKRMKDEIELEAELLRKLNNTEPFKKAIQELRLRIGKAAQQLPQIDRYLSCCTGDKTGVWNGLKSISSALDVETILLGLNLQISTAERVNPPVLSTSSAALTSTTSTSSRSRSSQSASTSQTPSREQYSRLEHGNRELQKKLDQQKQETSLLTSQFEETCKMFAALQEQNTRLMAQIGEKEDWGAQMLQERIKLEQTQNFAQEEKVTIAKKLEAMEQRMKTLSDQLAAKEEYIKAVEEKLANAIKETIEIQKTNTKTQACAIHSQKQLQVQYDNLQQAYTTCKKQQAEAEQSVIQFKETIAELEEECDTLQKNLEKKPVVSEKFRDLEQELAQCKAKTRCTLCNDREKNVVISRCFHVFCSECIESSLHARSRRCPSCQTSYGKGDVHKIWL